MCSLPGGFPAVIEVGILDSCILFVGWGWKCAHRSLFSRNSASLWVLGLDVGYPEVHYDKEKTTQVHGVRSIPLLIFPYFKVQSWEGSTANWRIFHVFSYTFSVQLRQFYEDLSFHVKHIPRHYSCRKEPERSSKYILKIWKAKTSKAISSCYWLSIIKKITKYHDLKKKNLYCLIFLTLWDEHC